MGLSVMETKLEVIDTAFIPEIDDIEVCFSRLSIHLHICK
jgi:hypothetical protein